MIKYFIPIICLCLMDTAYANYFYFWADDYTAYVDQKGNTYINTHIKASDSNSYTFTVNDKVIAKDIEVFGNEVVDFPISISNKYTNGFKNIKICSLKSNSVVNFQQQICLDIKLEK